VTSVRDLDSALSSIKAAARALLSNPHRRGNLLHLPAEGELLVTGDLHADLDSFRRIVETADLASRPRRHLILQELVHGRDSAGGRCASCELVEEAAALVEEFPERVHILMGNHEMAELTGRVIIKNGAALNELFRACAQSRYGERYEEALAYFRSFWRALPLAARTRNRVFVSHSTPAAAHLEDFDLSVLERPLEEADLHRGGAAYALCWGRDFSQEAARRLRERFDADCFIVGHTPCENGFSLPNGTHVILDSQGPSGRYALLPPAGSLTCADVAGRILPLWA